MRLLWTVVVASAALSVASAAIVDHLLTRRIPIISSFIGLELSRNSGIAFGIRLPEPAQTILIGIALVIVGIVAIRSCSGKPWLSAAFGLVLGGGVANIIDRIPDGLVTDFIHVGTFPTFNVADSCITVGAMFLLIDSLRSLWDKESDG